MCYNTVYSYTQAHADTASTTLELEDVSVTDAIVTQGHGKLGELILLLLYIYTYMQARQ